MRLFLRLSNWSMLLLGFSIIASTESIMGQSLQVPAEELVRQTVANELKAANTPGHYMYRRHEETPDGNKTEVVIETRDWMVGRLIQLDGKSLTHQQRRKEDRRLARLLNNSKALRKEEENQRKQERRVRKLVGALPDAFVFHYSDSTDDDAATVALIFQPNPAFRPDDRELAVLSGMKGTMLINTAEMRLTRVEATLFRSVSFGWGILAQLDPGGSFLLEEDAIDSGRWAVKTLMLHFTGRYLLFKELRIDSKVTTHDFRRMRDDLTLVQGLEILREQDEMLQTPAAKQPAESGRIRRSSLPTIVGCRNEVE